jgi:O-antigen/teichoic acid export membrane protein
VTLPTRLGKEPIFAKVPSLNNKKSFARFASKENLGKNLRTKSIRGALFMASGGGVDFILRFGTTVILARLLSPEHFGLVGLVAAITGIAEQIVSLNLSTATVQAGEISHEQCSNLFWINVSFGMILGIGIVSIAPLISYFYHDSRLSAITFCISVTFIFNGLSIQHEALLNRQMEQIKITINRLIANIISSMAAIIWALNVQTYWVLVWKEIIRVFILTGGVWFLCPWIPGFPHKRTNIRKFLSLGRDLTLNQFLYIVTSKMDSLLIGKYGGPTVLGLYRTAYSLIMVPLEQLNVPIYSISQPALSLLQFDRERFKKYYTKILYIVSLVTIPFGTFTFIFADEIVLVALGNKWGRAAIYFKIFSIATIIRPSIGTSYLVALAFGKSGRILTLGIIQSILVLIVMVAAIPWGAVGIAFAGILTSVLLMIPNLYYSFKETPVKLKTFFNITYGPVIAAGIMGIALYFFHQSEIISNKFNLLILGLFAGTVIYFISIIMLPEGKKQLNAIITEIISVFRKERQLG